MRKFLAVLMAVFMLAATLAVLSISAADAVVMSDKDGSTPADADAIDLVITEVLADTNSNNISLRTKNAYQYIEIYNRGDFTVNIYDYAIVRAAYKEKDKQGAWLDPKKFDKKIVLDPGSIYAYYQENNVPNIGAYATSRLNCVNADNGDLAPGQVALIWIWNDDTKAVISANGGTTGAEAQGNFTNFKLHYADMGTTIPENVKIFAAFGVDGIGQSCALNVSANYVYALVKDNEGEKGFDVSAEIAYSKTTGGNYTRNDKIVCMFKFGTSLGYYSTTENTGAIYTLANQVPRYYNERLGKQLTNYFDAGKVDSFKEMGCIFFEEAMTPGKLLPIQWADLDPDRAPADVKGTDANWQTAAWNVYIDKVLGAAPVPVEDTMFVYDEWTYFIGEDEKYYRYETENDIRGAAEITKSEYDNAAVLAGIETSSVFVYGENTYCRSNGKYYRYLTEGGAVTEIAKSEYDNAAVLAGIETSSVFVYGENTYFRSIGKYYRYLTAGGGISEITQAAYEVADIMRFAESGSVFVYDENTYCISNGKYYCYLTEGGSPAEITEEVYIKAVVLCSAQPNSVFVYGDWTYCISTQNSKYYKYKNENGNVNSISEISKDVYDVAEIMFAAANEEKEKVTAVQITLKGEWTYCIGSDGKYYKYMAADGSFDTAVEIAKSEYDAAMAPVPAPEQEKETSPVVWVLIGVGSAIVLMGGCALIAVAVMRSKKKQKQTEKNEETTAE